VYLINDHIFDGMRIEKFSAEVRHSSVDSTTYNIGNPILLKFTECCSVVDDDHRSVFPRRLV
jgi:hypothetical protein